MGIISKKILDLIKANIQNGLVNLMFEKEMISYEKV